jgi:MFS family permease
VTGALIGAIIAANYIGLVIGGKVGHFLIARVGHIRAYVSCAGIITAAVLGHGLTEYIPVWVVLRLIIGLCMMCQFMVLESWLNDQSESNQRGMVFGFYMAATYLGMSLGQVVLMLQANLGITTLLVIALCFALCLVPIALTTRTNARHMSPAPMELRYFIGAIPKVLATTLVIGMVVGSFYGLAPVYASMQALTTQQTGLFMAISIFAGLVAQFPLSWLSDRYNRTLLMRINAILLIVAALPLALVPHIDFPVLLVVGFIVSMLQFTLYPLANDLIEPERRVSLAACLLMAFGVGASVGPLAVGALIEPLGGNTLYAFFALCGVLLVAFSRTVKQDESQFVQDAPLPHIPLPDSLTSSPLSPALNPTFDEQIIHDTMPPPEAAPDPIEPQASDASDEEEAEPPVPQGADPDEDTGLKKAHSML